MKLYDWEIDKDVRMRMFAQYTYSGKLIDRNVIEVGSTRNYESLIYEED